MVDNQKLVVLRNLIQENLRVQKGADDRVRYIDSGSSLVDATSRQNHVVFARRGCGKSLLLHSSAKELAPGYRSIYLNCEDFKHHSFPNVIIEILDALFIELQVNLTGWFGRKKKSKEIIAEIRNELDALRLREDVTERAVRETIAQTKSSKEGVNVSVGKQGIGSFGLSSGSDDERRRETEAVFSTRSEKLRDLNQWLPQLKRKMQDFFKLSSTVTAVILQVDDFYHLRREDQPFLVDYIHRLCKDVPIYFKIATLKHASILYVDRGGQPIGAQERHDYQPINIDYTLNDFHRTEIQNKRILEEFGALAGMDKDEISALFKGEGFSRLVMAGGGVPRDTLSLFLEALSTVQQTGDGRIGKDDIRVLSKTNFERRIEELKYDAQTDDHEPLIKGIYTLRQFCLDRKTNCFLVAERVLQQNDRIRSLIYRLLDYRIIHSAGTALTHKSQEGAFQAFAVDIGCYAHLRKLRGKMNEVDLSQVDAKEKIRSTPVLDISNFEKQWALAPSDAESQLVADEA
ncbi:UNVERIFIED_ORG: hypothetical protein M2420_002274 [Stenotrophomonas maltophilia]